jgi:hypothetical protein
MVEDDAVPRWRFRPAVLSKSEDKDVANARPELKQFGDLTPADFERLPAWISCHGQDEGEPWYEKTNEETFRPWTGALPVGPSEGMLLVRARLELQDGSVCRGFLTPAFNEGDLGSIQPQIFVANERFGFWGGMFGVRPEEKAAFYAAIGKPPDAIFPIRFAAGPGLATGAVTGSIDGFYRRARNNIIEFER